jgi:hypothetical protein
VRPTAVGMARHDKPVIIGMRMGGRDGRRVRSPANLVMSLIVRIGVWMWMWVWVIVTVTVICVMTVAVSVAVAVTVTVTVIVIVTVIVTVVADVGFAKHPEPSA